MDAEGASRDEEPLAVFGRVTDLEKVRVLVRRVMRSVGYVPVRDREAMSEMVFELEPDLLAVLDEEWARVFDLEKVDVLLGRVNDSFAVVRLVDGSMLAEGEVELDIVSRSDLVNDRDMACVGVRDFSREFVMVGSLVGVDEPVAVESGDDVKEILRVRVVLRNVSDGELVSDLIIEPVGVKETVCEKVDVMSNVCDSEM